MATILFKGNPVETKGNLPEINSNAPDFSLTGNDLQEKMLKDFVGKNIILNIFPSIDTGTCAASVRRFNQEASSLQKTVVLCISKDLPFAQKRFCGAEGIENVITLSEYKNTDFSNDYGVTFSTGPLQGLMSRCVIIIDENGKVIYTEQVQETTEEPNYQKALQVIQ